jgi:hypothetical protein
MHSTSARGIIENEVELGALLNRLMHVDDVRVAQVLEHVHLSHHPVAMDWI